MCEDTNKLIFFGTVKKNVVFNFFSTKVWKIKKMCYFCIRITEVFTSRVQG